MFKCSVEEIQSFFESEDIFFTGSGTGALIEILTAINCKGKNVILPVMTCPNVAISIYAAGAIPVSLV